MLEAWAAQIAHIEKVVNIWCNFAIICGVIGFALSTAVLVYMVVRWKHGEA